jgi:hypothetical protein
MQLANYAIAAAVALYAVALFIGTRTMGKNTDATLRLTASVTALIAGVQSLIASSQAATAQMRETATNAATADDVSIQLNALADKVDNETAAIAASLADHTGDAADTPAPADQTDTPAPAEQGGDAQTMPESGSVTDTPADTSDQGTSTEG